MAIAALADIHGNVQALDAVLADPRVVAADRIVVLGEVNVGSVGRPCEGRPGGAYWALLGPEVELVHTDYDVEAAAEAVLASGQPGGERVVEVLLRPPTADEWSADREELRRFLAGEV